MGGGGGGIGLGIQGDPGPGCLGGPRSLVGMPVRSAHLRGLCGRGAGGPSSWGRPRPAATPACSPLRTPPSLNQPTNRPTARPNRQLYDDVDTVLLHDVVEVVGVVSKAPQLAALHMGANRQRDADEDEAMEGAAVATAARPEGADPAGAGAGAGAACGGDDEANNHNRHNRPNHHDHEGCSSLGEAEFLAAHPPTSQVRSLI